MREVAVCHYDIKLSLLSPYKHTCSSGHISSPVSLRHDLMAPAPSKVHDEDQAKASAVRRGS